MTHEPVPQPPGTIDDDAVLRVVKAMAAKVDVANAREARLSGKASPVKADSILAIPQPETLDLSQIPDLAERTIAKAPDVEHIEVLIETLAQTAMISAYLRRRDRDARRQLARADRALEVRIGELLGPTQQGQRTDLEPTCPGEDKLARQRASEFRLMADHKDDPAVAEAVSAGESRSKILRLIRDREGAEPVDLAGSQVSAHTEDHAPAIDTKADLSISEDDLAGPDAVDALVLDTSSRLEDALDVAQLTLPTAGHVIDIPVRQEAAQADRPPLQVITEAVETLSSVADQLEQTEPGEVGPDDLAPLVESMSDSLRRIDHAHRLMKDWLP